MKRHILSALALALASGSALGQTSTVTYQGELKDNGQPANGSYDLHAFLYTATTGGTSLDDQCFNDTPVTNGRFTVNLPFGVFARGGPYYLEVKARRHTTGVDCNTTTGFTTLTPRQQLTSTPFANFAYESTTLVSPSGLLSLVVSGAGDVYTQHKLGIGVGSPTSLLDIAGAQEALRITGNQPVIRMRDSNDGNKGVVLQDVGGGFFTVCENFLNSTNGTAFSFLDRNGNLALGSYTPNEKLTIAGSMEVGTSAGDYQHIRIGGGNNSGYIYGSYPRLGDGIHMGYNCYSDASLDHIIAADGSTSRLSTGYGFISLATNGVGQLPVDRLVVNANGTVGINIGFNAPAATLHVGGNIRCTSLTQTSSGVFKDEVTPLAAGLDDLMKLEPVSYVWNEKAPQEVRGKHDLGFIAEEVAHILPDAVGLDNDGKPAGIDYSRITVLAVKAIKEQQAKHEADLAAKQQELDTLRERLERLEKLMAR